jgi:hypothetical protein
MGIGAVLPASGPIGNLAMVQRVSASSGGGPMVLDGMDPACHSVYGEGTENYIAKVLNSVYSQSTMPGNNGKIAILDPGTSVGGCGSTWAALMPQYLSTFATAPEIEYFSTSAEIDAFFASGIISTPPRVIWIPDNWGRSGSTSTKFTNNAEKIADFVNSGGGLFANYNTYGWLTALLPGATFNDGGCNGGPNATADGLADFGLTNADVTACWHGYFTGDLGGLKTLAEYRYPDPTTSDLVAVSIGGGDVSLPSSFTLSISPESPNAGEDLTITAVAQLLDGTLQSGVVVTVTVSEGPDAGQTFTATTDSTGTASIVVRTASEGTAVYTATATVNGVEKTVSVTVAWNPPTTTTEPSTTTTEPAPTTTEPAPTTTEPVTTTTPIPETTVTPVPETTVTPAPETTVTTVPETTTSTVVEEVEQTTTTVHDHSTHDHGDIEIPMTGKSVDVSIFIGFMLILVGLSLRPWSAKKLG